MFLMEFEKDTKREEEGFRLLLHFPRFQERERGREEPKEREEGGWVYEWRSKMSKVQEDKGISEMF